MQKMASSSVPKWNSFSVTTKIVNNLNPICQATQQITLKEKFIITHNQSKSIPGKFINVKIYSHDAQTTIYKIKIHADLGEIETTTKLKLGKILSNTSNYDSQNGSKEGQVATTITTHTP